MSDLGNKQIMASNIQHYMDLYGKTRNDMCEAIGVKYTTFTDWVKGHSYPRIDKIEMMANYFGISKADLVERHTSGTNTVLSEDEFKMVLALRNAGKNKTIIMDIATSATQLNAKGLEYLTMQLNLLCNSDEYKKAVASMVSGE